MNNTTDSFYNSTEQSNLKLLKKKKKNIRRKPEEEKLEQKNFVCVNTYNNVDIPKQEKVMLVLILEC